MLLSWRLEFAGRIPFEFAQAGFAPPPHSESIPGKFTDRKSAQT